MLLLTTKQMPNTRKQELVLLNLDEQRLKEIQEYKRFYQMKLDEDNTELGVNLIKMKIEDLENEEKEILKRCKVEL